jgi:hypothetical protein
MIATSLPVLVFEHAQKIFVDMSGFPVYGVHCKIVRHRMDSGMEEEFLDRMLGISSNKGAFNR